MPRPRRLATIEADDAEAPAPAMASTTYGAAAVDPVPHRAIPLPPDSDCDSDCDEVLHFDAEHFAAAPAPAAGGRRPRARALAAFLAVSLSVGGLATTAAPLFAAPEAMAALAVAASFEEAPPHGSASLGAPGPFLSPGALKALAESHDEDAMTAAFDRFAAEHERAYADADERAARYKTFKANVKAAVRRTDAESRDGGDATYGVNHLADWTAEETQAKVRTPFPQRRAAPPSHPPFPSSSA
jgi:hypothetical protein